MLINTACAFQAAYELEHLKPKQFTGCLTVYHLSVYDPDTS